MTTPTPNSASTGAEAKPVVSPLDGLGTGRFALLQEVETYLARTGMKWSRFGRAAVNDSRYVADLRQGREPRPKLALRVRAYIVANPPAHSPSPSEAA